MGLDDNLRTLTPTSSFCFSAKSASQFRFGGKSFSLSRISALCWDLHEVEEAFRSGQWKGLAKGRFSPKLWPVFFIPFSSVDRFSLSYISSQPKSTLHFLKIGLSCAARLPLSCLLLFITDPSQGSNLLLTLFSEVGMFIVVKTAFD